MLVTFAPPRCFETTAFATTPSSGLGMTMRRSVGSPMLPAGVTRDARSLYSPGFGCGGSFSVSVTGVPGTRSSCFVAMTGPLPLRRRTKHQDGRRLRRLDREAHAAREEALAPLHRRLRVGEGGRRVGRGRRHRGQQQADREQEERASHLRQGYRLQIRTTFADRQRSASPHPATAVAGSHSRRTCTRSATVERARASVRARRQRREHGDIQLRRSSASAVRGL